MKENSLVFSAVHTDNLSEELTTDFSDIPVFSCCECHRTAVHTIKRRIDATSLILLGVSA